MNGSVSVDFLSVIFAAHSISTFVQIKHDNTVVGMLKHITKHTVCLISYKGGSVSECLECLVTAKRYTAVKPT